MAARRKRTYIHMNHRIRERHPSGPVIAVHRGGRTRNANTVTLLVDGKRIGQVVFRQRRLRNTKHSVRAWIWLSSRVEVVLT